MTARASLSAVLLLAVAAGLRSVHLDRGVTGDEVILYELAQRPLAEIYSAVVAREVYSPLAVYPLHFWMRLGAAEVWVRLYFVLFGLGLCAVVYGLARELLGGVGARLALGAAAVSPLLIASSQYIRSYTDASFWSALGLLALLRIWRGSGGRSAWLLYATATVIAFYTFYFTVLVWTAVVLWMSWRLWVESRPWRPWIVAHAAMAAAMVPGLVLALHQLHNNASGRRFNWAETGFQVAGVHAGILGRNLLALLGFDAGVIFPGISRALPTWVLALLMVVVLMGTASILWAGWRRLQAGAVPNVAPFCVLVALFPLVVAQITGERFGLFANAKYLVTPHAMFLLLMVAAVLSLPHRALAVAACALLTLTYASRLEAVYQPEFDARGVERYITTIQHPGTIVLFFGSLPVAGQSGLPGLDVHALVPYDFRTGRYRLVDRRTLDATLAGFPQVIYVRLYSNQEVFGGNAVVLDYLATRGFALEHTKRFKNIDVMILVRPRPDAAQP